MELSWYEVSIMLGQDTFSENSESSDIDITCSTTNWDGIGKFRVFQYFTDAMLAFFQKKPRVLTLVLLVRQLIDIKLNSYNLFNTGLRWNCQVVSLPVTFWWDDGLCYENSKSSDFDNTC